jgi:Flp pilus assembly pilin Flp
MRSAFWKINFRLQNLILQEEAQDLVEYALVLALIAIAVVAAVGNFSVALINYYHYINSNYP